MNTNAPDRRCIHCIKLAAKPRSATPHSNLSYQNNAGFFSFGSAAADVAFVCRICQSKWTRRAEGGGYEWTCVSQP